MALSAESLRAQNIENNQSMAISFLNSSLTGEIARAKSAESILNNSLVGEIARALSAENILNGNISAESLRTQNIQNNQSMVISFLNNSLTGEIASIKSAESILNNSLVEEIARALSAENILAGNISTEVTARLAVISSLNNSIYNSFNVYSNSRLVMVNSRIDMLNATIPKIPSPPQFITVTTLGFGRPYLNGTAIVSFFSGSGGTVASSFSLTTAAGDVTAFAISSPITVSNLTGGITYVFYISANNVFGSSNGALGNSVLISTVPQTPSIISCVATSSSSVNMSFMAMNNGGVPIGSFIVTSNPVGFTVIGLASPITIPGLNASSLYNFSITANNTNGLSTIATTNSSIGTYPATPSITGAVNVGQSQAYLAGAVNVSFTSILGNIVQTYIVSAQTQSSNITMQTSGSSSPIIVLNLAGGTSYSFTVTAINWVGNSTPTAPTAYILVGTVPQAPAIGTATIFNSTAAIITFTTGNTGGSIITGFTILSTPVTTTQNVQSSPYTMNGLVSGTTYTFTITALNANGASVPSAASNAITLPILPVVNGGILTTDMTYNYRAFPSTGTLNVSAAALIADFLLIGGGGASSYLISG